MNSINILLSSQQIEQVSPDVVSKLYDYALHSKVEDLLYDLEMSLSGKIQTTMASTPAVRYLSGLDENDNPKFPNLEIIVPSDGLTIEFRDPSVKQMLLPRVGGIAGGSFSNIAGIAGEITPKQAAGVTNYNVISLAYSNDVLYFYEWKYFTHITSIHGSMLLCSLKEIEIPSFVTFLGASAFSSCSSLKRIIFKGYTQFGGDSAFSGCNAIERVDIPDEMFFFKHTSHGWWNSVLSNGLKFSPFKTSTHVYTNDVEITSVTVPENIISVNEACIAGCKYITSFTLHNSITNIGKYALAYSGVQTVNIPNNVVSIGDHIFYKCESLTAASIGNQITSIPESTFEQCSLLSNVTIPNSVTTIGVNSFYLCSALNSIIIPSSVTTIGNNAFDSSGLTSIDIPSGVTSIGNRAFYINNNLLRNVRVYAQTPPTAGTTIFNNVNPLSIYVPDASVEDYKAANNWSQYASRIKPMSEYVEPVTEP